MLVRWLRSALCICVLTSPACAIKLADRNSPAENGAVTGPAADCSNPPADDPGGARTQGDPAPRFVGRFFTPPGETPEAPPGSPVFDWSGNYITFRVQKTARVVIKLAAPVVKVGGVDVVQDQMFTFVVDGLTVQRQITAKPDNQGVPEEDYPIENLDPNVQHDITIYKNTEAQKGAVTFKGIDIGSGEYLPPTVRPRRIEFIGDSITCGYGNMGQNATCPFEVKVRDVKDSSGNIVLNAEGKPAAVYMPLTENQYLSFAAITARALDADAVTICWSGKGVYLNYRELMVPNEQTKQLEPDPDAKKTVPDLWRERIIGNDPEGAKTPVAEGGNKWDFALEKPEDIPQVVVINLGTNDFSRDTRNNNVPIGSPSAPDNIPDGDLYDPGQREALFTTYRDFVKEVRTRRPNAHIFIATPPMITDQFPLENARTIMRETLLRVVNELGDPKVYKMDLVEQGFRYGLGCDYHPNLDVHQIMAKQLVGAIRSKTCWR